jgi:hypothetical protein
VTPAEEPESALPPCRPLSLGLRPAGDLSDSVVNRVFRHAVALHLLDQHEQPVLLAVWSTCHRATPLPFIVSASLCH